MPRGIIFWVIMLIWAVSLLMGHFAVGPTAIVGGLSQVLEWVLFALIGWQVYGPMVRG